MGRAITKKRNDSIRADLVAHGYRSRGGTTPVGGCQLRQVLMDKVDLYLDGSVRDPRSFPRRDSRGVVHDPILSYWTFVNYSKAYKPNDGVRAMARRCGLLHVV